MVATERWEASYSHLLPSPDEGIEIARVEEEVIAGDATPSRIEKVVRPGKLVQARRSDLWEPGKQKGSMR